MALKELTKSQVWQNFRDNYYFYLDEEAPHHVGKTSSLFKKLCDEQGLETTNDLLEFIIKNWRKLKAKYRLAVAFPTMGVIYGFRQSLLGDLRENQRRTQGPEDTPTDKKSLYLNS